jgi:hypothetical protein
MGTVTILRDLWRHRRYVVGVAVLAIVAGLVVMYRVPSFDSRKYDVGVASAHILVDTPSSQVVEVAPPGSEMLGEQAALVASLMVDGTIKSAIAQQAGVQPSRIVGVTSVVTQPSASGPAPVSAPTAPGALVITTNVLTDSAGNDLPIIDLSVQAPTPAEATRLLNASISGLRSYLDSQAAAERVPDAHRLQITTLGVTQASSAARGPSNALALGVVIALFVVGCLGILAVLALVRGWRAAAASEQLAEDQELPDPDLGPEPTEPIFDGMPSREAPTRPHIEGEPSFGNRAEPSMSARREWVSSPTPSAAQRSG